MARVATDETRDGLIKSMWQSAGIQFRSNLATEPGQKIELHAHSYDHVSIITYGLFAVREINPQGEVTTYLMASKGYTDRVSHHSTVILAHHQHSFTLIEASGQPGEVLCMWAG